MNATMDKNEKTDAGGNDGNDSEGNQDSSEQLKLLLRNLQDAITEVDLDDVMYYCISFVSVFLLPLSALGATAPYYTLRVNIRPVSESIHSDLNCDQLNLTAEVLNDTVCSMETFETKFSLYIRQVNYFHFTPTFGDSFCGNDGFAYRFLDNLKSDFGFESLPEDTLELIGGGNIGKCTQTLMLMAAGFAAVTMGFTILGLLWVSVFSTHHGSKNASIVHMVLAALNMIFSAITIIIFSVAINPLRPDVNPSFCDDQTTFEDCEESLAFGFYCQLWTAILSFLVIPLHILKMRIKTTRKRACHNHHHHLPFYKNPHFYIKLGRFAEFFLAVVACFVNFTTLSLVLPDIDETPVSMSSYLWGDQFCSEKFFAMDEFRPVENDVLASDLKNFGDCKAIYKYKVIFTLLKIVTSAGSALFLKRDAAKNPFIYLGGLAADFATIGLVIMAITVFMTKIYPGRSGIEPPFCDQYVAMRNDFLDEDVELSEDICNISLGSGFWMLCLVLPLTIVNLVVEFLAGEIGQEYGAINAFQTVMKRLKRKDYQDALFGASSFYRSSKRSSGQNSKRASSLESVKEVNADSMPREIEENALNSEHSSPFRRWLEKHDSTEMKYNSSKELKSESLSKEMKSEPNAL